MRTRTTEATAAVLAVATLLGWLMASDRPATTLTQDKPSTTDPLPSWNDIILRLGLLSGDRPAHPKRTERAGTRRLS
jgi:hypothetical protein